ncbi:KamA family radical SAM protein [Candidatus Woesearchaeota archaeon]|nr:KamA family radical SAM protein [Candidatus Woesearchaeota archaeon]
MPLIEKDQIIIETKDENILWKELLEKSITDVDELNSICKCDIDVEEIKAVIKKYPMKINPYYLSLIRTKEDVIWRQCIPDKMELMDSTGLEDPLHEEVDSPVPGLTHRYPDRVLLLVSNQCPMYCRFCTRKRKVGVAYKAMTRKQLMVGIDYIREHKEVRDVLLSGGDPLLLPTRSLQFILSEIRKIKHVQIIRIGTRAPCTLPQRITKELCDMLQSYQPLYINTHFNHPREITKEAKKACEMLADAGIPVGNQSVLLKGVNDTPKVMKELVQKLLTVRVKPYYIYQADLTKGTNHFRTRVKAGLDIIKSLVGFTSGMCVPHYIIDSPGGGGKIPILPKYAEHKKTGVKLKNYEGRIFWYPEPRKEKQTRLIDY